MWEIYAYHNSDSLFGIFNAIAAMIGSTTYTSAVAAVVFCGFAAAGLAYAFAPEKLQGWKWIASVVLVYSVLLVPRVTVGIVDKTGGAPVKVVANVPFGIALFGGLTSSIGNSLTEVFETAFQAIPGPAGLSPDLTYQRNGLMFGNRLIRSTRAITIRDPLLRTDLINFIHNCTMYDLIDGTLDPAVFGKAQDVWPLMGNPNPARFTTIRTPADVTNTTCPEAYANISARLPGEIAAIQGSLAFKLNPTLPPAVAASAIADQIHQAYIRNQIAAASVSAADIVRQNALINVFNDSSQIIGQKINDPASLILALGRAQAVAQQNAAWINGGKIAEQALPIVRNVVEAMIYAMFPLFVLLLFLTSGRETAMALKSYLAVLIWIQLWPPLYAILNYMATIYAQFDLAAAAEIGGGLKTLSLQTASSIYSNAVSAEAVVGYLVASIPFIAWAAMKRMETLGTAVVGGLAGLQSTVAASTAAAATGNVALGNVSMDQRVITPITSNAWVSRSQSLNGDWITTDGSGRAAVSKLRNEGFASRVVALRVSEQEVTEASKAVDSARQEVVAANQERSAVFSEAYMKAAARLHAARAQKGSVSTGFEELASDLSQVDQIINEASKRTGVTQSQAAQILFGVSGHFGLGMPSISPVNVAARVEANANKSYLSGMTADEQQVLGAVTKDQVNEIKRFGDRISRDTSFAESIMSNESEAKELSSRITEAATRSRRAEAAYTEKLSTAERLSNAREQGETISIDLAQDPYNLEMFRRYTEQYGGNSASARIMIDAELARQAPRPNRVFSDGTAMPISFGDVSARFSSDAVRSVLNTDLEASKQANDRAVGSGPATYPAGAWSVTEKRSQADFRNDLRNRGANVKAKADQLINEFEQKNEIDQTQDGILTSKRSLLKQASNQVAADAQNTAEKAKDVVREILKP